jgi:glucose-1-phosphate thymidylyltransferase
MINVIVPAAGVGTRLRPHTYTLPKALLHVAGKPILGHIIERLAAVQDLGPIWIVVGFKADQIESYVRSTFDLDIRFVRQHELRGLGHAIYLSMAQIPNDNPILTILGDTILDVDLGAFMSGGEDILGVKAVTDPRRFGVVELDANAEYITGLVEKPAEPRSNIAAVGLYGIHSSQLFRSALAEVVAADKTTAGEIQATDAFQLMIERGCRMRTFAVEGWYDCGKFETMLETNRFLLERGHSAPTFEDSRIIPPSFVSPSATIERSVIGPYASIGKEARITDSIVTNAIIFDRAEIRHCILEDSIVGTGAKAEGRVCRVNAGALSEVKL